MTPRRGSRGGAPGGGPDAAAASEAGVGDADLDEDEPRLGAMRQVWLAMRDEAPSDRGLGDLLAAARHKAEAMQPKPAPWQWLLAALRRPPGLALATAVVVIGSGVIIGRRVGEPASRPVDAAGEQVGRPQEMVTGKLGEAAPPPSAAPGGLGSTGSSAGAAAGVEAGGELGSTGSSAAGKAAERPAAVGQKATPVPARNADRPTRRAAVHEAPSRTEATAVQRPAPWGSSSVAPRSPRSSGASEDDAAAALDLRDKADEGTTVQRGSPSPPPRARDSSAGSASPTEDGRPAVADRPAAGPGADAGGGEGDARAAPTRGQPPRVARAELYQQCEAAATRGDCAAVRQIVNQITRIDRGYLDRLAKDSAVARCLAE